jgi:carbonic anhydrase/acetyltransferase-like protein (isoleucine patch superfamily)
MGSPGRVVKQLKAEQIEQLRAAAAGYVDKLRRYRRGLRAHG